jgi:hypothetical protein
MSEVSVTAELAKLGAFSAEYFYENFAKVPVEECLFSEPSLRKFIVAAWFLDATLSHINFDPLFNSPFLNDDLFKVELSKRFEFVMVIREFSNNMKHGHRTGNHAKSRGSGMTGVDFYGYSGTGWGVNEFGEIVTVPIVFF